MAAAEGRRAAGSGPEFLGPPQSPGGCWQDLQAPASPQHLLLAPRQEWERTVQADVLEVQGRPVRGRQWGLLEMHQLKRESRLKTHLILWASVCGDIYLLAALVHLYSPYFLNKTKSNT